jgi:hypothetical protein
LLRFVESGADAVSESSSLSSAQIIPFPIRPGSDPQNARLVRALAALDVALTQQRTAIAAWRDSLAALRGSTADLGASVVRYRASLGELDAGVTKLNGQARALERWADNTMTPAPG